MIDSKVGRVSMGIGLSQQFVHGGQVRDGSVVSAHSTCPANKLDDTRRGERVRVYKLGEVNRVARIINCSLELVASPHVPKPTEQRKNVR